MGRRKKNILILLLLFHIIISWYFHNTNYHFVANTDLRNEQIGNIRLGDSTIGDISSTIQEKFTTIKGSPYYYSVSSSTFTFGANQEEEIVYIVSESEDLSTRKEIRVGSTVDGVRTKYGENFVKSKEMGIGNYIMYVDRSSDRLLRFWYHNRKVNRIDYQYL